jgi:hypothetical protein
MAKLRGHAKQCQNTEPHEAHVTGQYSTVRYGQLNCFCPGLRANGKPRSYEPGDAHQPAVMTQEMADEK